MFGKSRATQADKAIRAAEAAADVAAEKALAAQQAQEALYEQEREQRRAERKVALEQAKQHARHSAAQTVDTARERARATVDELKGSAATEELRTRLGQVSRPKVNARDISAKKRKTKKAAKQATKKADVAAKRADDLARVAQVTASLVAGRASSTVDDLRSSHAADVARERSAHAALLAKERGVHAAEAARHWAEPRLEKAKPALDRAREKGFEAAAPRMEHAAEALAPRIDDLRDRIVQDMLPRLTEAVNAAVASLEEKTNEAASSSRHGLSEVATRAHAQTAPGKKKRKGGRRLLFLSAVGAAGAASYAAWKSSQPSEDPWAVATAASQTDHAAPPKAPVGEPDAGAEGSDRSPFDPAPPNEGSGGVAAGIDAEDARQAPVSDADTTDGGASSRRLGVSTPSAGPAAVYRTGASAGDEEAMEPIEVENEDLPTLDQSSQHAHQDARADEVAADLDVAGDDGRSRATGQGDSGAAVYGGYEAGAPDTSSHRPPPAQAQQAAGAPVVVGEDLDASNRPAQLDERGVQDTQQAEEMFSRAQGTEQPRDHQADVSDAVDYDEDQESGEEGAEDHEEGDGANRYRGKNILPEQ